MKIDYQNLLQQTAIKLGAILLITVGTFVSLLFVERFGFSYQSILLLMIGLALFAVFISHKNTITTGMYLWILFFGLGYRTIYLTSRLQIHPLDVVLWGLLAIWLINRRFMVNPVKIDEYQMTNTEFWIPSWLPLLIPFWVLAWLFGQLNSVALDRMLREFLTFLALYPIALISFRTLQVRSRWKNFILYIVLVGGYISLIGIVEYIFPSLRGIGGGVIADVDDAITLSGFRRASFAFWGSTAASFICLIALPFVLYLWQQYTRHWQRVLTVGVTVLMLVSIYIGGYRSLWLIMSVMFVLFISLRFHLVTGLLSGAAIPFIIQLLPPIAVEWVQTLIFFQGGEAVLDSSQEVRRQRIADAWSTVLEQPWGTGWAETGWVHSDIFQMLANQGFIAAIIFFGAFALICYRLLLFLQQQNKESTEYYLTLSLLLSMVGVAGLFAVQGVQVLPQLAYPCWFIWILSEIWVYQNHLTQPAPS